MKVQVVNHNIANRIVHIGGKNVCRSNVCRPTDALANAPKKWLQNIRAGAYGTCCDGSVPLTEFFVGVHPDIKASLIKRGLSTNIEGVANCFLKSKWDNPISTSAVFDCSVLYLANENTETHFLYHMFKDSDYDKIQKTIKQFMPEGFTHAAIVPGDSRYVREHKKYLNEVYTAVKDSNQNAEITVYHYSSKTPEVVGYKGYMHEIPMQNYSFAGQNTFPIQNIHFYDKLYLADIYNSSSSLQMVSDMIAADDIDKEAKNTMLKYIQDKIASLTPKNKFREILTGIKDNFHLIIENIKLIAKTPL